MISVYSIAKPSGRDLRLRMTVIAKLQIPGGNPHHPQEPLHQKQGGRKGGQLALRRRRRQDAQPRVLNEKHPSGFRDRSSSVFLFGVARSSVDFQRRIAP